MPAYTMSATTGGDVVLAGSSSTFTNVAGNMQTGFFTGWADYCLLSGFGFTIPLGETIVGIEATINCFALVSVGDEMRDKSVRLYSAATVVGTDHGSAVPWTSSAGARLYGTSSDTWGLSLVPADVNAAGFGILISPQLVGGSPARGTVPITQTSLTITTTTGSTPPIPPPSTGGGTGGGALYINTTFRRIPPDTVTYF